MPNHGSAAMSGILTAHQPVIVSWNRLEARPRAVSFTRSLRAEIHDALWMLTRQWQLGEFKGEDSGSPLFTRLKLETTRITRYAKKKKKAVAYDESIPMETTVEKERPSIDLLTRIQTGQYWFRLLDHKQLTKNYRELYRTRYPILYSSTPNVINAQEFSNRRAWQLRAAAAGRAMDGAAFYNALENGEKAEEMTANELSVDQEDNSGVADASSEFMDWYKQQYTQPQTGEETAWAPEHLEYQIACSVPEPDKPDRIHPHTVMVADEYYRGHLDWYSFDVDPTQGELELKQGVTIDNEDDSIEEKTLTFLPNPVSFAGMPNVRWWEIEDKRTGFPGIDANTTDIAKLLLMEFSLIFSNDWHYIPYSVPVGSLCEIRGLEVTNGFGQRTLIKPAGQSENDLWRKWNLFNLTHRNDPNNVDHRLFLPPTVSQMLEGSPIESVNFIRDEMANMVWGIESIIPDDLGGGMDGYESATDLLNLLKRLAQPTQQELMETEAKICYILENTPPENWIPFIPVQVPGSNREIQLQRARLLRAINGLAPEFVEPRGDILLPDHRPDGKYFIHEEEIPRAGAIVTRSYQRTRWFDGSTYIWLGQRKQVGRGEGSSGLKFDQIEPIEKSQ